MSHRREEKDARKKQQEREDRIDAFAENFDPETAEDVDYFTCSMDTWHEEDCLPVPGEEDTRRREGMAEGHNCVTLDKWDLAMHFEIVRWSKLGMDPENLVVSQINESFRTDALVDFMIDNGIATHKQLNTYYKKARIRRLTAARSQFADQVRLQRIMPSPGEMPNANGTGLIDQFGRRLGGDM